MVEMKPKDFLVKLLNENLVNEMELIGFKYVESKFEFYKNYGVLKLNIRFELDKYTFGDRCKLTTNFYLTADSYRKWYFDEWKKNPDDNSFINLQGADIPNWKSPKCIDLNLNEPDSAKNNIDILKKDILETGINFFINYSYWDSVSDFLLNKECPDFLKAGDMNIMANKHEQAYEIYNRGLLFFESLEARSNEDKLCISNENKLGITDENRLEITNGKKFDITDIIKCKDTKTEINKRLERYF